MLPEVPYADPEFAELAEQKIADYEQRIKDGAEKKQLDALEEQLLAKLVRARREAAIGEELTEEDLRLEMRREDSQVFDEEQRKLHKKLSDDADRTLDPEERQALEAYEAHLLVQLREAHAAGDADLDGRFDALTVADVRRAIRANYSADRPFSDEEIDQHAQLAGQLDVYRRRLSRWKPVVLTVRNAPGPPSGPPLPKTHVLTSGDYRQPGEAVEPGFPSVISGNSEPAELTTDRYRQFPTRGLRFTLARWIASPENPLTARVMVNRLWQHHFGRGIVETASNFGKNGSGATHPELLDWLATQFVEEGWSVKQMHRLMLLSSTYRQSSENPAHGNPDQDPDNRLLWKFERRRIEAEVIRDGILYLSGGLQPTMWGALAFSRHCRPTLPISRAMAEQAD